MSKLKDQLVANNIGLVWSIVRRFLNRGCEAEDLFQIGSIGLMKAIDKFDTGYEVKFSTYAVPMIAGEIRRFLRDDGMLKVSRTIREHAGKVHGSALLRGILCKHQFHGLCPPLCASNIPRRGVAHHTVFLHSGKILFYFQESFIRLHPYGIIKLQY